jgi:hypothetical protein
LKVSGRTVAAALDEVRLGKQPVDIHRRDFWEQPKVLDEGGPVLLLLRPHLDVVLELLLQEALPDAKVRPELVRVLDRVELVVPEEPVDDLHRVMLHHLLDPVLVREARLPKDAPKTRNFAAAATMNVAG